MKIDREAVHSKFGGRCAYCGTEITLKEMQVDHMWPKCGGGTDEFQNLAPACRKCNHYKRANTVNGFRILMNDLHTRIQSIYIHEVAVRFGMATIKPFNGVFYFETLNLNNNQPAPAPVTGNKNESI